MSTNKVKQGIHSLLPAGRQVFSHHPRTLSQVTVTWEDKCHHAKWFPIALSSLRLICRVWFHMVWKIVLILWSQLSQLCPLPSFCAPTASTLGGQHKKQKAVALCKPCSTVTKTSLYYTWVSSTISQHGLILVSMKNIESTPKLSCLVLIYCERHTRK